MRLPWPFGRRTPSDGPPSAAEAGDPGDAGDGGARPADDGASPATSTFDAAPTGAWASLPPIQRTVGAPPLVAPSAPFLGDVPGVRHLPPIVQPLGHEASASAPPGLVAAHAHPVPSLTSHAPLAPRPVQRRAAHDAASAMSSVTPGGGAGDDAGARPGPAVAGPESAPVRHLATVSQGAAATPPSTSLTRTAPSLAPLPVTAVSPARSAIGPGTPSLPGLPARAAAGSPAVPPTVSRWAESRPPGSRPGLGAPVPSPMPGLASRRRLTEPSTGGPAAESSSGGGPVRRAGLGSPISVPPASAVAQRLPARSGIPVRGPGASEAGAPRPGVQHGQDAMAGRPAEMAAAPRPLPVLPVARRHRDDAPQPAAGTGASWSSGSAPSTPPAPSAPSLSAATTARSALSAATGPVTRPTLGARPIRTGATVQRKAVDPGGAGTRGPSSASSSAPSSSASASSSSSSLPMPVSARWDAGDGLPSTVTGFGEPAGHGSAGAPAPVQLMPLATAAPSPSDSPTAIAPMREITFPARDAGAWPSGSPSAAGPGPASAVQRLAPGAGGSSTTVPGAWPASLTPPLGPGSGDPARGSQAALTLAHPAPAASPAPAPAPAAPAVPTVARIVSDPASPAASQGVQGSQGGAPAGGGAMASITATPVVQRVEGAAPAAEPQAGGHSDSELDELARALFGRIRTHLRAEVVHEREAKGLTFDAF